MSSTTPKAPNEHDAEIAGSQADFRIAEEVRRQDAMWGRGSPRTDIRNGELMKAAMAQLEALDNRRVGVVDAFDERFPPETYPDTWSGFRDYGSDVANLVVAAAWLRQEIARLIAEGADTTRLPRRPQEQPYRTLQPAEFHE